MQLLVHCPPLLIQPGVQFHLDEIHLDIHRVRWKMDDVCPLLLLTSDFAETTSVSIGCYSDRPYMFGCIDHVGVKQFA